MSSERRQGGGVFDRYGRTDQTRRHRAPHRPHGSPGSLLFTLGRVDELVDGMCRSVDAATGAASASGWPEARRPRGPRTFIVPGADYRSLR